MTSFRFKSSKKKWKSVVSSLPLFSRVCFAHSTPLLPDHKSLEGHRAQKGRHWEEVKRGAHVSELRQREGR